MALNDRLWTATKLISDHILLGQGIYVLRGKHPSSNHYSMSYLQGLAKALALVVGYAEEDN